MSESFLSPKGQEEVVQVEVHLPRKSCELDGYVGSAAKIFVTSLYPAHIFQNTLDPKPNIRKHQPSEILWG